MKKSIKHNWLKIYAIFVTICVFFVLAAFGVVFHRAGYDTKVLVKLGLIEQTEKTNWAVVGWNNTLEKLDYDADVVFLGDSITCGSDFREYFPQKRIVNLGYPGDTLAGMIDRVPGVTAVTPEKVFVMGGINGLTDFNVDKCISEYEALLNAIEDALPEAQIYIQSVLPISFGKELSVCHNSTIKDFNNRLATIAKDREIIFIDLFVLYEKDGEMNSELTKDGIHLWPEAYELWADAIADYVN